MKRIIHVLLVFICVVALVNCKGKTGSLNDIEKRDPDIYGSNEPGLSGSSPTASADSFEIVGTIIYKNMEGGFYAIDGDSGDKYDPISIPEAFRKDGLRVKVTARQRVDVTSFHMYGTIIEVVNIIAQ